MQKTELIESLKQHAAARNNRVEAALQSLTETAKNCADRLETSATHFSQDTVALIQQIIAQVDAEKTKALREITETHHNQARQLNMQRETWQREETRTRTRFRRLLFAATAGSLLMSLAVLLYLIFSPPMDRKFFQRNTEELETLTSQVVAIRAEIGRLESPPAQKSYLLSPSDYTIWQKISPHLSVSPDRALVYVRLPTNPQYATDQRGVQFLQLPTSN
jgi:hypothetical protein